MNEQDVFLVKDGKYYILFVETNGYVFEYNRYKTKEEALTDIKYHNLKLSETIH
jgi:hypothetical protein